MSLTDKFNSIVLSRPLALAGVVSSLFCVAGFAAYTSPMGAVVSAIAAGICMNRADRLKQQAPKAP